jgi:hypothetical protein
MKHTVSIIFIICLISISQHGQSQDLNPLEEKIYRQIQSFPQEKIHIHTDKTTYVSGEKIWYRAFLVDALLHSPSYASRYVYVELITPVGELVSRDKIRPDSDSLFHNNISLPEDLAEGMYLIRAYTNFMRNRPDYFFEKKVFVADPHFSDINVIPQFTSGRRKSKVSVNVTDKQGKPLKVERLSIHADTAFWDFSNAGKIISFKSTNETQQLIYAQFEINEQKYKRYLPVPKSADDFDVSFFPEGGYLIANEICKLGFKALKTNGLSEDITGIIVSDKGDTIANMESEHAGMGMFSFQSVKGLKYYAVCRNKQGNEKRFQLPDSHSKACALKVFRNKDNLYITVLKGDEFTEQPLNLVVHIRGAVIYAGELPENNTILIEKEMIPSGVTQVLLLDDKMNPLSERMFFNFDTQELTTTDFSTDKAEYSTREHVSAKVQITDRAGNPLAGSFSVSVTDDGYLKPDSLSSIVSELLLCSDIRGYIESPEYYINKTNSSDILMLTQAWKRYDIPAVLKDSIEKPTHYLEAGQEISGKVKRMIGNKANVNNTVSMVTSGYVNSTMSDENGRFVFNGFEFPDSTMYVVQALSKRGTSYVELVMDQEIFPDIQAFSVPEFRFEDSLGKHIEKLRQQYFEEHDSQSIMLDSVIIKVTRPRPKSKYSSTFSVFIYPEDLTHINDLDFSRSLKLFPRLHIFGGKVYANIDSNSVSPVFIIDDWVLYETELRDISDLNIQDIESIEYVDPLTDSISLWRLPFDAPGGLIIVTTKSKTFGKGRKIKFNVKTIIPKGYRKAAEFYSPKYETEEDLKQKKDLRTTIFWKPNVILENGAAKFDFYTADSKNTYSIIIEGITDNGQIIRKIDRVYLKK